MIPPEPSFLDKLWAVVWPTDPAEFWTMLLTVATGGLVFVAWRGLRSLGLARSEILTRAKRDSLQSSMDRAREWAEVIIPLNFGVLAKVSAGKIPVFVSDMSEVRFDPDPKGTKAQQWCASLPADLFKECIWMMNRVEAWSMDFTTGLADAEPCFGPCAPTFCQLVTQNYAIFLLMRSNAGSGTYPHTITLYKQWIHQLEEKKRGFSEGELLARLQDLQRGGAANPNLLPRPIGTDIDK